MQNKKSSKRIGLIGIYHESNTFLGKPTLWKDFQDGHFLYGKDILEEYRSAFHEIGGMAEVLNEKEGVELVPILYAEATPGGIIEEGTAESLLQEIRFGLERALPLDGLMVVPHGAAVSQQYLDFDGYWLRMAREILGPEKPIVGTIDPHCNLSPSMAEAVDAFIAYKTNPHIDQRQVGREAAALMLETLEGKIKPCMKAKQMPVAISIEMQHTSSSPCLELYQLAREIAQKKKVLSISVVLGFPYADVPEMGSSLIVITDEDSNLADSYLKELEDHLIENHQRYSGDKISLEQLAKKIEGAQKPVLLLDMGDNVGGGSPGDSTFLLEILEGQKLGKCFICLYDPDSVQKLKNWGNKGSVSILIGAKTDEKHGKPLLVSVSLLALVDGKFIEKEPRHGGQLNFNMGETAIVKTSRGNTLMLTSRRTVPFSLQQLLQFHIDPQAFDIIVAKGVHAPLAAYGPVCNSKIRVNTPGVTRADMENLFYNNRRKPLFPFEKISNYG